MVSFSAATNECAACDARPLGRRLEGEAIPVIDAELSDFSVIMASAGLEESSLSPALPPSRPPSAGVIQSEDEVAATAAVAAAAAGDMESEADETRTKLENFKYYTSLVLGTLCIVCIFTFLFLVPFVLDPAISTLMHEFVDAPVTCKVSSVRIRHGKTNCNWTSCREGCTADMFICYQVWRRAKRTAPTASWSLMIAPP